MNVDLDAVVLLVDDSEDDIELTILSFKRYGMTNPVVACRNGLDALAWLRREPPYRERRHGNPVLMLVDMKMPVMDGVELVRNLKADPEFHDIPVVMLTASAAHTDIARSYDLGVNGYVVKPVERDAFAEAIKAINLYWLVVNRPPEPKPSPSSSVPR